MSFKSLAVSSGPDLVEELHERVVNHEGDGNVEADAAHPGDGALVEGLGSLVHPDLLGAVPGVLVPVGLQTLHPRLDNVQWSVAKDGAGAGEAAEGSHHQLWHRLLVVVAPVPALQGLHNVEADGLVAALFHDGS